MLRIGWGGMARPEARVTGITLSTEQLEIACARGAAEEDLADRVASS